MPIFNGITLLPEDPILSLPIAFAADQRSYKVNLGIGAYKTADGQSLVLTSVKKAESLILQKQTNKEYAPIDGHPEFIKCSLQLLFGLDHPILKSGKIYAAQTVGGTGALRIGGELLAKCAGKNIFISQPTWQNHKGVFERAGLTVGSYPYFDAQLCGLDFAGMCQGIKNMPAGSIILLHGCCHNPTGVDPTFEQWKELSSLLKKHQIIPFFDMAYQGFGQDLNKDAQAIRYFASEGHEMLVAYSYAKNFGLYGERAGFLTIITAQTETAQKVASHVKSLIRTNYSSPPIHGSKIVTTILKSSELTMDWEIELKNMRDRVNEMRTALIAALLVKGHDKDFSYIHHQRGLFSFCGLTPDQVHRLRQEKGLYMPSNGRLNIAGLNTQNIDYVAESLLSVL